MMKPRYQIAAVYDEKSRLWAGCLMIDGKNNGCITHGKIADEAITRAQRFHPDVPVA